MSTRHRQTAKKARAIAIAREPQLTVQPWQVLLLLGITFCLAFVSQKAKADELELNHDSFIHDDLKFNNPLSNQQQASKAPRTEVMDNEALYQAASNYQNTSINASQRALNHQWLRSHHHNDNVTYGGKALSKILKIGLNTYWNGQKTSSSKFNKMAKNMLSDKQFGDDVRYNLKMSGNKLNLSVKMEF